MLLLYFSGDLFQTHAADARRRPGEIFIETLAPSRRLEDLRAAIRLVVEMPILAITFDHTLETALS